MTSRKKPQSQNEEPEGKPFSKKDFINTIVKKKQKNTKKTIEKNIMQNIKKKIMNLIEDGIKKIKKLPPR